MQEGKVSIGHMGETAWVVSKEMLASSVGSGTADVFSTPFLLALMESAAVDCLSGKLEDGYSSVGTHIDLKHVEATPLGMKVTAVATVSAVDGRKVTFDIVASDEVDKVIGEAKHTRFILHEGRFMEKLAKKKPM